ncbi:16834_t:CDS:1, partial [Racocetra persica]
EPEGRYYRAIVFMIISFELFARFRLSSCFGSSMSIKRKDTVKKIIHLITDEMSE